VSLSGATTAQGTSDSSPVATSGGSFSTCGLTGTWEADVYVDTSGAANQYNIRYQITNTTASGTGFRLVQVTDYSNDGTVDVDYRTNLPGNHHPFMASRGSGDAPIIFDFTTDPIPSTSGSNSSKWFFVNAESSTYATTGGHIDIWTVGGLSPCTITTSAAYPHN